MCLGRITGMRFYKGFGNTGTHIGLLWSSDKRKLAEVTFSNETASGWQTATFPAPVPIVARAIYVVAYLAPNGRYAVDNPYAWQTVNAAPLHLMDIVVGLWPTPQFPGG